MRVHAGKRDTLITFEAKSTAQDATYGTLTNTWMPHAQEWAEVQDVLPSRAESAGDNIVIQQRPVRIRTMYRSDITSDMRVTYDDRTLEIVGGPVELGRRDGLELVCQDWTTQGDQP